MPMSLVYRIPLFGWMLKDAAEGTDTAVIWFLINVLLTVGLLVYLFGYAALIIVLLTAVAAAMVTLIALTAGL